MTFRKVGKDWDRQFKFHLATMNESFLDMQEDDKENKIFEVKTKKKKVMKVKRIVKKEAQSPKEK